MNQTEATQSAALPYRYNEGLLQILLVTSRRRRRWTIPKGKVSPSMLPHTSAAREALQEAGVVGIINSTPIGIYYQRKKLGDGSTSTVAISAFALPVSSEVLIWPEMHLRERAWFSLEDALKNIESADLRAIIRALPASIGM